MLSCVWVAVKYFIFKYPVSTFVQKVQGYFRVTTEQLLYGEQYILAELRGIVYDMLPYCACTNPLQLAATLKWVVFAEDTTYSRLLVDEWKAILQKEYPGVRDKQVTVASVNDEVRKIN